MIPFTQYLRPDGRRKEGGFERPAEIEGMANVLLDDGVYFDAEVLMSGHVSLTAEVENHDGEVMTLAHEVCQNDENIGEVVDKLIRTAYEKVEV